MTDRLGAVRGSLFCSPRSSEPGEDTGTHCNEKANMHMDPCQLAALDSEGKSVLQT